MIKDIIYNYALTQPDRPAIVSIDKAPLTYAHLQQQIEEIGAQLRRGGFSSEARIGVALLDGPEAIVAIMAVACHAAAVPINNSLGTDELWQLFEQASLDAIVLTHMSTPLIRNVANELKIAVIEAFPDEGEEIACSLRALPQVQLSPLRPPSP
jgi:acyl-CoA synthetase (AMP-forming)/AMP-acid ligase II